MLDYFSEHKTRLWGEQKVLASGAHFLVYCAFADDDFYVVPLETLDSTKLLKVHVFEEEAEWTNLDSKDHISDICIATPQRQIIVVNGKNGDFLFFDLESRQRLRTFSQAATVSAVGTSGGSFVSEMRYAPRDQSVYYTAGKQVGHFKVGEKMKVKLHFRHPCKVVRVVAVDGRLVATIAEDNILRVWDLNMKPFQQDLAAITGQVHVKRSAQDGVAGLLGDLLTGTDLDASSVITSQDVKNYWSRDASTDASMDSVDTRFHALGENERYVVVTQSHFEQKTTRQWTRCLSVWDLSSGADIVRRAFFPVLENNPLGTMYVHGTVGEKHAFVQINDDDITFALLDLMTWQCDHLSGDFKAKKVWKSRCAFLRSTAGA